MNYASRKDHVWGLMVETTERLRNARARAAKAEISYLTGVRVALRDLHDRLMADVRTREENLRSAELTTRAFLDGDPAWGLVERHGDDGEAGQ